MRLRPALPGLALVLIAAPFLAGCAALGLPPIAGDPFASEGSPEPGATADPGVTPASSPTFFSSHDGYAMTLPAGWAGTSLTPANGGLALQLLGTADPALGTLAQDMVDASGATISMLGGQITQELPDVIPPGVTVAVLRTRGIPDDETRAFVWGLIGDLPGAADTLTHSVVTLPAGDAHRFDLNVEGDVLGSVHLRIYLFSVGDDAIIVTFAANADAFPDALPAFDSIIKSLRFGV